MKKTKKEVDKEVDLFAEQFARLLIEQVRWKRNNGLANTTTKKKSKGSL